MPGFFSEPDRRLFWIKTVMPIMAAAILVNLVAWGLLVWATREADYVAVERQHNLVELIVSQMQAGVAHDQESATVWDDAVLQVRAQNFEWIDVNLGSWMHSYFGHDGAFVLDSKGAAVYGLLNGKPVDASSTSEVLSASRSVVARLRTKLMTHDQEGLSERVLSPGVSDVLMVLGRPAVVSAKPVISDTGEIELGPEEPFIHVALRFLDGSLLGDLKRDYLLDGLRFDQNDNSTAGEASSALRSTGGELRGFLIWSPYRPGSLVFQTIFPVLVLLAVVGVAVVAFFLRGLRRRSLRLKSSEATVRHLALHDLLTGLPNRAQFADRTDAVLSRVRYTGETVAILYLDLDRFKEVNDTFGHPAGDAVLKEFSDRLRGLTRGTDTVARLGGDEFTVLLYPVKSDEMVVRICQRLIETARHPFEISGTQVFIGVSVGVAFAPRDGFDRVELTRRADVALYQAKAAGRSDYAFYTAAMDDSVNERRDLERDLKVALTNAGQLEVHYQPLYSATANGVSGVEALLRWKHPQRGWIAPDLFIPIAEESGLIEKLGQFVMQEACSRATAWPVDTVAVNVSAIEMRNPNFALKVAEALLSSGLDPRRLEIELTESALSDKGGQAEANISTLRAMGVRFALDDFGTGFSSLGRLHDLKVDRIKIDRSFVQGFGKANGDEAIIQAIVDLAKANGLKTTAEGVETGPQSAYLRQVGCDDLQGFLLSKPLPASEIEDLWVNGEKAAEPLTA